MKKIYLVLIMFISISLHAFAQRNMQDVIYLKNGTVVKGRVIDKENKDSITIKKADSSIVVFKTKEIKKITIERESSKKRYSNNNEDEEYGAIIHEGPIEVNGRHFYQNSQTKTIQELKSILAYNPASEEEIKIYKTKTTVRDLFCTLGSLTVLVGATMSLSNTLSQVSAMNKGNYSTKSTSYLGVEIGGLALATIGMIAGIGSKKHLRKSIEQYNASIKQTPRLPSFYSSNDSISTDTIKKAPSNKHVLTNELIIQMSDNGLSNAFIIEKIHQEPNDFDLSQKAIGKLNRNLVAVEVIEEMKKSKK